MDNKIPIVLAQYTLGKTLGIGAFGKVKCKLRLDDNIMHITLLTFLRFI